MKILLVGHDASLTGAPKLLLALHQYLSSCQDTEVVAFIAGDGPLLNEHKRISRVYQLQTIKFSFGQRFLTLLSRNLLRYRIRRFKPDCIIYNTIAVGLWAEYFSSISAAKIAWIHELEFVMRQMNGKGNVQRLLKNVNTYIVPSRAVANNLTENHEVIERYIYIVYGGIELQVKKPLENGKGEMHLVGMRNEDNIITVGGCGSLIWRKGFDLFILVVKTIQEKFPDNRIRFIWVGGNQNSLEWLQAHYEIDRFGLKNVEITGEVYDTSIYFSKMDIFLMTSREDPFPLVNLEAANAGLPIICFNHSGGSVEFVCDEIGYLVPYSDIQAMSDKVIELVNNPDLRTNLGRKAKEKSYLFSIERMTREISNVIEKVSQGT